MAEETQTTPPAPKPAVDANDRVAKVFDALWNDKDLGSAVRRKAKEMFDDVVLPEDTMSPIVEPLRAELDATKKQLSDFLEAQATERKEREEASAKQNLEDALSGARSKYNLTDEGFDKMVARMKETSNYTDADAAAAWVAQQTPVKNVNKADWLPRKVNFLGSAQENANEKFKLLHTNPEAFLDAELEDFASDPDRYVAETFGMSS